MGKYKQTIDIEEYISDTINKIRNDILYFEILELRSPHVFVSEELFNHIHNYFMRRQLIKDNSISAGGNRIFDCLMIIDSKLNGLGWYLE
jgi:hypothetical protein